MEVSAIIAGIDGQIEKLQEARRVLESVSAQTSPGKAGRGRPKGSKSKQTNTAAKTTPARELTAPKAASSEKRKLRPEGRKRIADAMKRRWAERRKAVVK